MLELVGQHVVDSEVAAALLKCLDVESRPVSVLLLVTQYRGSGHGCPLGLASVGSVLYYHWALI